MFKVPGATVPQPPPGLAVKTTEPPEHTVVVEVVIEPVKSIGVPGTVNELIAVQAPGGPPNAPHTFSLALK